MQRQDVVVHIPGVVQEFSQAHGHPICKSSSVDNQWVVDYWAIKSIKHFFLFRFRHFISVLVSLKNINEPGFDWELPPSNYLACPFIVYLFNVKRTRHKIVEYCCRVLKMRRVNDLRNGVMFVKAADSWHQPVEGPNGEICRRPNDNPQTERQESVRKRALLL